MLALAPLGCDDAGADASADASAGRDLGAASPVLDQGRADLGGVDAAATDAHLFDAGRPDASGPEPDPRDLGAPDLAEPLDAEPQDAEPRDAAAFDAEPQDAQALDQGPLDASAAAAALGLTEAEQAWIAALSAPLVPAPDPTNRVADDPAAARLGQALFFSDRLGPSIINCAFCHVSATVFSHQLTYDGLGGLHNRSVPSLVNSAVQTWFFWDGRADSAWSQAATPLEDPEEMASDRLFIAHALAGDPALGPAYEAVFGELPSLDQAARFPARATPRANAAPALQQAWAGMAPADQRAATEVIANVGKALAAYERRLVRADSAFDRFARGLQTGDADDLAALSEAALQGLRLFIGRAQCVNCHNTPAFSDGRFHNLGQRPYLSDLAPRGRAGAVAEVLADPLNAAGEFSDDPQGERAQRLTVLAATPESEGAFRTPTLRNVARTLPYGHDGRYRTLEQMVHYKLAPGSDPPGERDPLLQPLDLDEAEVAALVAFLNALTSSELPADLLGSPLDFP